jgi:hypothetical protein
MPFTASTVGRCCTSPLRARPDNYADKIPQANSPVPASRDGPFQDWRQKMRECSPGPDYSTEAPGRYRCPVNGREYPRVKTRTLLHHVKQPWELPLSAQGYYFCDDPDCDVVYFGQDDSVVNKEKVRTRVWQKAADPGSDVCYCFGVSREQAKKNKAITQFIAEQTKKGNCACTTRNPSGRCCLKDFK